jgi:hypothetical protein
VKKFSDRAKKEIKKRRQCPSELTKQLLICCNPIISAVKYFLKPHGKQGFLCTASLGNENVSENIFISLVPRASSVPCTACFRKYFSLEIMKFRDDQ